MELLVGDVLRTAALRHPTRAAAALGDTTLSFGALDAEARACAARLAARGVGQGDRVGWIARNSLEAVVLHSACAYIGAIFSPFDPASTPLELAALLDVAQPSIVLSLDGREATMAFDALPSAPLRDFARPRVDEDDCFVIFFTSGTTGSPKGAMLSHRTERLRGGFERQPRGPHVSMFPQFHMAGWVGHLEAWNRGDPIVWVDRPEPEQLFAAIERHRAYSTYLIPAVWRRVFEADRRGWDLSSLGVADTGTSSTSPDFLGAIKRAFPDAVTSVVYGSTEAHRVCVLDDRDLFSKPYSVGLPQIGTFVRRDEVGELWVKSPMLFSGYFDNDAATADVIVDGWYRTGDVVEQDQDGYFSVVGRTKELIRTGGETVSPLEVEAALLRCTGVVDAAVAGVPDDDWGEVVTAFVAPSPGTPLSLAALQTQLREHLAPQKLPRRLLLVDAIPRTGATGQVARARLVALAKEQQSLTQRDSGA